MSQTVQLAASKRADLAPKDIRKSGSVTAEIYGAGQANEQIQIPYFDFRRAFAVAGESTIIELSVDGGKAQKVLVHDIQRDPVMDTFTHIDFFRVDMNKKVTTHVALRYVGEAPAVKTHGGIFNTILNSIEIRCLPADLPHDIEVDISTLENIHDVLHVSDLKIDAGKIEVFTDAAEAVCNVLAPKTAAQLEAELAAPVGDTLSEEARKAAEEEKAAAQASKVSDTEKKGEK